MKKLYLVLLLPVNIIAMDGVRFPFESGINWGDKETFNSAWTDQKRNFWQLQMEFETHAEALFPARIQQILEEHGKCTCFIQEDSCDRFKNVYDRLRPESKREIAALLPLLGEQQPSEQGALIYRAVRKVSIALAKKVYRDYGTEIYWIKHLNMPMPYLEADEKQVLEDEIFPQLDQRDVGHINDLIENTGLLEEKDYASDDNPYL